jgi:DNA invertase Pin-like site-specific DNA recombinase
MNKNELTNQTHALITPDHLRRRAVIYVRQSTEKQVRENTGSTDFQRSLAEVARSYGWPDSQIEIIDEDLGITGSSSEWRIAWQRLQEMIEAKQVGAVFVATISRMARQVLDFELFRLRSALHNTLLYTDGRFINPADSLDTIVSQISAIVAHFENRKRTELMTQSRLTKARKGEVVSKLPVGWIKGPDGRYHHDPEAQDAIRIVIETFWQERSIRRTVKALAKAGVQIPYRDRRDQRICLRRPTCGRVTRILTHPAYAGTYVYGITQSQPGGPVLASGQSKRIKVPEERWLRTVNHHPGYMTQEQQEEIKAILKKNNFRRRDRPGRGRALMQGLLRCVHCGTSFAVNYGRSSASYACWKSRDYAAEKACTTFISNDFDQCILREVFKVLKTPPIDMLKSALEASRNKKQTRLDWIKSERERLAHEERMAQERAELTRGSLQRVHRDALERLEKVLEEKEQFEQKIALEPLVPSNDESEEELVELCRLVSTVPSIWHHKSMTNQERKEVLRCVIERILVAATKERIDATIVWKSGSQTLLCIWRHRGRHHLIRELHAQKLTALEIKDHLAAGKTSTGQVINISLGRLYLIMQKLGLKQNRFSARYVSLRQKAAELYREGRTLKWIAQHFNEEDAASPSGRRWTRVRVRNLLRRIGEKVESLENLHRRAITEAHARGLNYQEMALEFNEKKLRRMGCRRWTAQAVAHRWSVLNGLQRKREQKQSTGIHESELEDALKSV